MPFSFARSDAPDAIPVQFVTRDYVAGDAAGHGYGGRSRMLMPVVSSPRRGSISCYLDRGGSPVFCLRTTPPTSAGATGSSPDGSRARCPLARTNSSAAGEDLRLAALAFALGSYSFTRYGKPQGKELKLALPADMDVEDLTRIIEAVTLARDLVNTPTNDMGPSHLEEAVRAVGEKYGAKVTSIVGDDLLRDKLTLIHAVGRSSVNAPRLIDLSWGDPKHPKVTLVGKGVCFDSGGLDIKPSSAMLIMKKDMGGAANVLALAQMIMSRKLKVRLRRADPVGRELDRGGCVSSARCLSVAQGPDGRDRQYRCGRPARSR